MFDHLICSSSKAKGVLLAAETTMTTMTRKRMRREASLKTMRSGLLAPRKARKVRAAARGAVCGLLIDALQPLPAQAIREQRRRRKRRIQTARQSL